MNIFRTKKFTKAFQKLRIGEQERVEKAIRLFQKNPFELALRNHELLGTFAGIRSISAGGDIRILFREKGKYVEVVFLTVGSHAQMYG